MKTIYRFLTMTLLLVLVLALPGRAAPENTTFAPGDSPPARFGHTMVNLSNRVYLFGGMAPGSPIPQNDLWEYDAEANNWSQVLAADPPPARAHHSATVVDGQLVVVGGIVSGGGPSSETWVYDTVANSWEQGQDFPDLGYADSMASGNGKAYVIGHTQGQLYEAVLDGGSAQTRRGAMATSVRLLIFGGLDDEGQVSGDQYVYDPAAWYVFLPLVLRQ